jgi:hypothetical protein
MVTVFGEVRNVTDLRAAFRAHVLHLVEIMLDVAELFGVPRSAMAEMIINDLAELKAQWTEAVDRRAQRLEPLDANLASKSNGKSG